MPDRMSYTHDATWVDVVDDNNPPAGAKPVKAADIKKWEDAHRDAATAINDHDTRIIAAEADIDGLQAQGTAQGTLLTDVRDKNLALTADVATLTDRMAVGEETMALNDAISNVTVDASGAVTLSYFTARKATVVTKLGVATYTTAAAATPTLCRIGLYKVEANGTLTLVASCPNTTSLFAAANTRYQVSTSAPYTTIVGQQYALAVLVVSAAALPSFVGAAVPPVLSGSGSPHRRLRARMLSQTDLPASITAAQQTDSTATTAGPLFGWMKP